MLILIDNSGDNMVNNDNSGDNMVNTGFHNG